ncbi:hypothetical protein GCM10027452_20190 [Micromonospora halotolerans]
MENHARKSTWSVAPTVMAAGTFAGETPQASSQLLPAATAYVMPEAMERVTASLTAWSVAVKPRLMLATAGLAACAVTQSMPAITCSLSPLPAQSSTRTATRLTSLATPYFVPPMVPATCVP